MSSGYSTIPSSSDVSSTQTVSMSISSDRYNNDKDTDDHTDEHAHENIWSRIVQQKVGRPSHKMVVLFHSVFKLSALIVYIGASFITNSFIGCFIMVMILLSADFWLVKNVSGRLLAGLRWWSVVTEDGQVQCLSSWAGEDFFCKTLTVYAYLYNPKVVLKKFLSQLFVYNLS